MATVKDLFKNLVHIGHRTSLWNPKMKPFIHDKRNGAHIFDLDKTAECLDTAQKFLAETKKQGKQVLFVGTKPQASLALKELIADTKYFYVDEKWAPGLLTNFKELRKRIDHYLNLKSQFETGEIKKYTKKEVAKFKKDLEKLDKAYHGVAEMRKKPDVLIVLDAVGDIQSIREANVSKLAVVAITDTNADPDNIDFPIPANDDSVKSVRFLIQCLLESLA